MNFSNRLAVTSVTALAAFVLYSTAYAKEEKVFDGHLDGGVVLTSDSVWRGISESAGHPAILGEIKWTHKAGFFLGIWGGSVDYGPQDNANSKFALFGGYSADVNGINFHAGYLLRYFPSDNYDGNFSEITASLGYKIGLVSIRTGLDYSWDYYAGGQSIHPFLNSSLPLSSNPNLPLKLVWHGGYSALTHTGFKDYTDWNAGIATKLYGLNISARYYDANIKTFRTYIRGSHYAGSRLSIKVMKLF